MGDCVAYPNGVSGKAGMGVLRLLPSEFFIFLEIGFNGFTKSLVSKSTIIVSECKVRVEFNGLVVILNRALVFL